MSENTCNVVKCELVVVKGEIDREASIANFLTRIDRWTEDSAKAKAEKKNEERIKELTQHGKIAETSAKVLATFGNRYAPRDLYMGELLSSLTCSDGIKGTHPELYQRVKVEVEAWIKGQVQAGSILTLRGKSGGIKAADSNMESDLAQAAE